MYPFIWYQFLATFSTLHPSFHHRSTLAPASLHPRITLASPSPNLPNHLHPFHLPFHPQLSTYFTPFLCLSGRARSCGEAARQGVENPNRWENIGTCRKQWKAYTLHCMRDKHALARPVLCNGAAVFGSCPKRIIPTKVGNSFKEKFKGKLICTSKFQKEPEKIISIEIYATFEKDMYKG